MRILPHILRKLGRDDKGTALVELCIVIPLFLLLVFAIIDYGRLYWHTTTAQKAMQKAARLATVGPPLCGALPDSHTISGSAPAGTKFGVLCRSGSVCSTPTLPDPCGLDTSTPYGARVWDNIERLLPPGTDPATNVQITYSHDTRLGFLGGPYTPVVTAELVTPANNGNPSRPGIEFDFVMPLASLAALAASDPTIIATSATTLLIPSMSTSVPAEDLAAGASE